MWKPNFSWARRYTSDPGYEDNASFGVRRINNVPMLLFGIVVIAILISLIVVAIRRGESYNNASPNDAGSEDGSRLARAIVGDRKGGDVPLPDEIDEPPVPVLPMGAPPPIVEGPDPVLLARKKEAEDARRAKTQVSWPGQDSPARGSMAANRASGNVDLPTDPATLQARIADVRGKIEALQAQGVPGAGSVNRGSTSSWPGTAGFGSGTSGLAPFQAAAGGGNRWALGSAVEPAYTPYLLRAGFVIPSMLITGINSDLPGQVSAQVAQHVYDTPTGKHLLIPQGSRLVGAYASDVAYGQSRVMVAWQRIVFPDGRALDIGEMPGADAMGNSGFGDRVNNHYLRIFGSALLLSGITAGITWNQENRYGDTYSPPRAGDVLSQALGQQLGSVASEMVRKNMNIAPTLEIRPGYRFNVTVVRDIALPSPYKPIYSK
nr:TrbI/VirB10 family protein [uncultured Ralstonia sp.]